MLPFPGGREGSSGGGTPPHVRYRLDHTLHTGRQQP